MPTQRWLRCWVGALLLAGLANSPSIHSRFSTSTIELDLSPEIRSLRPSYPFSIVPGGVYSAEDVQRAKTEDPVVREHYDGINTDSVRLIKIEADQLVYVSYRKQNKVFWTHRRLRIPKGELLITDGTNYVRARCGNRLSPRPVPSPDNPGERADVAMLSLPTAAVEPGTLDVEYPQAPGTYELAQLTPGPVVPFANPDLPAFNTPGARPRRENGPFDFLRPMILPTWPYAIGGSSEPATPDWPLTPVAPIVPPPVEPVPEPGSLVLAGLGALAILCNRRKLSGRLLT